LKRLGLHTVGALSEARGLAKSPGASWSLTRNAPRLVARAAALRDNAVYRTEEEHSFLMPPRADVRFFLSVDYDPVDDRIAAIGYRRVQEGAVAGEVVRVPPSAAL